MLHWWVLLFFALAGCAKKDPQRSPGARPPIPVFELGSFGSYTRQPVAVVGNLRSGDRVHFFENEVCGGQAAVQGEATASSLFIPLSLDFYLQQDYGYSVAVISTDGTRHPCLSLRMTFDTTVVMAGASHTCAVLNNGLLKCWGEGADGRTGLGATDNRGDEGGEDGMGLSVLAPGATTEGGEQLEIQTVALGGRHTCALMTDSTLRCWGDGGSGQLGNGQTADVGSGTGELEQIEAARLSEEDIPVQAVSLGDEHSCAVMGSLGQSFIKCWGGNGSGQLGLGDEHDRGGSVQSLEGNLPAVELGGEGVIPWRISAGGEHSCAVFTNGGLKCWGKNSAGQLGLGDTENRGDEEGQMGDALPYIVLNENIGVREVSAGGEHTCALLNNGLIKCWGLNNYGQLGLGDQKNRGDQESEMGEALPEVILGSGYASKAISAGRNHSCAISAGGTLFCWGKNDKGQLGLGDNQDRNEPVAVDVGEELTVKNVSAGGEHTCALLSDNSMKCWGEGGAGQLLTGTTDDHNTPPSAMELDDTLAAKEISMGTDHACALLNHGLIKCWGKNDVGQLGQGDTDSVGKDSGDPDDETDEIPTVNLGTNVIAYGIAVGTEHSCAIINNGMVKCWGKNNTGQLGMGNSVHNVDPHVGDDSGEMGDALATITFGGSNRRAVQIGAGEDFTCVLVSDGKVRCWGKNDVGQLGRGDKETIGDNETATAGMEGVTFPSGVAPRSLSVGRRHACIVGSTGSDNKVYCWGDDSSGQLGQNSNTAIGDDEELSAISAVDFGLDDTVKAVTAGEQHTCAILSNDQLVCWGDNTSGQLGRNSVTSVAGAPGGTGVNIAHTTDTVSRVSLGEAHTCVVASVNGTVECWGNNSAGQLAQGNVTDLGDDTTDVASGTPLNLGQILRLELGGAQSCAINRSRRIRCWGEGGEGQLGRGNGNDWGDESSERPPWSWAIDFGSAAPSVVQ